MFKSIFWIFRGQASVVPAARKAAMESSFHAGGCSVRCVPVNVCGIQVLTIQWYLQTQTDPRLA